MSAGGNAEGAQSALIPRPTIACGRDVPRPVVSPEEPGQLAHAAAIEAFNDQVVRPLEADGPIGQPGDLLRRVGHGQAGGGDQAPDPLGRQPVRPEPERQEQRGAGRRQPGPSVAATTGRLLVGHGQADLIRARGQPLADDVVRGPDAIEPLLATEERGHRAVGHGRTVIRPPRRQVVRVAPARRHRAGRGGRPPAHPRPRCR